MFKASSSNRVGATATGSSNNYPVPSVPYPINNYGNLKQAIQLWCDRDDEEFCGQIPNFIDFAQKDMYRILRLEVMQKEAYLEIDDGWAYVPSDWVQSDYLRSLAGNILFRETSYDEVALKNAQHANAPASIGEVEPIFARVGYRWAFYPKINAPQPTYDESGAVVLQGNEVVLGYYADVGKMESDSDTSGLLNLAPDFFLYTACKHASLFCNDPDAADRAANEAERILKLLEQQNHMMDYKASPKVIPKPSPALFF